MSLRGVNFGGLKRIELLEPRLLPWLQHMKCSWPKFNDKHISICWCQVGCVHWALFEQPCQIHECTDRLVLLVYGTSVDKMIFWENLHISCSLKLNSITCMFCFSPQCYYSTATEWQRVTKTGNLQNLSLEELVLKILAIRAACHTQTS